MYALPLLGLTAVHGVHAWGNLGHETIAYVASNYVQSSTAQWAQNILGDTSSSYLANVATWADSYRYTSAGRWSEPFHFIDAQDNPPSSCNVDYNRDCIGTGCIVSALANYTNRVQESSLSDEQVFEALKFIIHFTGDITQPLHDENYEYGANDVDVTFNGESTNLHHVWDTNIPETLQGGGSLSDAQSWANDIINEIDNGEYSSRTSSWVSGINVNDVVTTAMGWASDANAYVCTVVMPNGVSEYENAADIYPSYYNSVLDTLQLQIAKGGYRLAKFLDAIAANAGASKKRSNSDEDVSFGAMDLTGANFLPPPRKLTAAQRKRAALGHGCNHPH